MTQVQLEIRVDGGGGEAGEDVAQLAQDWPWTHGAKVMLIVIKVVRMEQRWKSDLMEVVEIAQSWRWIQR